MRTRFRVSVRPGWHEYMHGSYTRVGDVLRDSYVQSASSYHNGCGYYAVPHGRKALVDRAGQFKFFRTLEECHTALLAHKSESPFYVSEAEWHEGVWRVYARPGEVMVFRLIPALSAEAEYSDMGRGFLLLSKEVALSYSPTEGKPRALKEAINVAWPTFEAAQTPPPMEP